MTVAISAPDIGAYIAYLASGLSDSAWIELTETWTGATPEPTRDITSITRTTMPVMATSASATVSFGR